MGCQNPEDISKLVQKENFDDITNQIEHDSIVSVIQQLIPGTSEQEIKSVFEVCGWDHNQGIFLLVDTLSRNMVEKLSQVFPEVYRTQVEQTVLNYFPDESAAMKFLQPHNTKNFKVRLLEEDVTRAGAKLEDALVKQDEFLKYVKGVYEHRNERQLSNMNLPQQERILMERAQELLQQREENRIAEGKKYHDQQVAISKKELSEAEKKLSDEITTPVPLPNNRREDLNVVKNFQEIFEKEREKIKIRVHNQVTKKNL